MDCPIRSGELDKLSWQAVDAAEELDILMFSLEPKKERKAPYITIMEAPELVPDGNRDLELL